MISIIIPSYKPQKYIWECLDSFARQKLSHDLFEVIVVVNGCEERYKQMIIDGVRERNYDFHVAVEWTETSGVSNARNIGLDVMRGDFASFVDDDDYVSANYLIGMYDKADKETLVICKFIDFDEATKARKDGYQTHAFNSNIGKKVTLMSGHKLLSSSCGKLIHKEMIGKERFNTSIALGEDALFMAQISKNIKNIVLSSRNCVYFRCVRPTSASHTRRSVRYYVKNTWKLLQIYVRLYCSDKKHYSFPFFFNRMLANTKRMFIYTLRLYY